MQCGYSQTGNVAGTFWRMIYLGDPPIHLLHMQCSEKKITLKLYAVFYNVFRVIKFIAIDKNYERYTSTYLKLCN